MKYKKNLSSGLYATNEYVIKNPSLHEEDSPWKVSKVIPLVDKFITEFNGPVINLLDVGGGAGLILNLTSDYIRRRYKIKVDKIALDLSPQMLVIQKNANPDLTESINEDIRKTSIGDKKMDLALMIDILEHIQNPQEALVEVSRISKFIILKAPLENNLFVKTLNLLKKGEVRNRNMDTFGHINIYNFNTLKRQTEKYAGEILSFSFTNISDYFLHSDHYKKSMNVRHRLINSMASGLFGLSPKVASFLFGDSVMLLVRSY